jgi:hypothetical protein
LGENATTKNNGDWFGRGLRFECVRCGGCCRGESGYVWVGAPEIVSIAGYLSISIDAFEATHLRRVGERISLVEKPNGDCVFWEHSLGCRVYPVRPAQCRTFPFWKRNIKSAEAWEAVAKSCPGIGQGKLFKPQEILKRAERTW